MEQEHRSKPEGVRFPLVTCLAAITVLWIASDVVGVLVGLVRHALVLGIAVTTAVVIARIIRARNN